jgi:hypothetical protein
MGFRLLLLWWWLWWWRIFAECSDTKLGHELAGIPTVANIFKHPVCTPTCEATTHVHA